MKTRVYEFDGISTKQFNPQDRELFTEYSNGILVEKEPFVVELVSKEVKLHLYIEHIDMSEFGETNEQIISIGVVPSFESLSTNNQQGVLEQFTEQDQEYFKNHTEELLEDSINYGFGITLRSEELENADKVKYKINSAIAIRHSISGLIGFELDRYVNHIGNTGWDLLADYCNDEDIIQKVLKRCK